MDLNVVCTAVLLTIGTLSFIDTVDFKNVPLFAYDDSRLEEKVYELPHGENDGRCRNPKSEIVSVKTSEFGVIFGKTVCLWDNSKSSLNDRSSVERSIRVYLGIPYAEPPIEDRRFQPPRPIDHAHGNVDAFHFKPSCPQNVKYIGANKGINETSEDCLYLNIYTPDMHFSKQFGNYSVMMYIHGGNWDHGSANLFPAHMLAAQGVIVVTFNYRIGHLGFLSTGDDASVGNYGMLDQVAALKWVHRHIGSFGGNQSSITLFGFDVGAVSASLLAISPLSRNLVRRVIAQNGSPLADWATIIDPKSAFNTSRFLGKALGCAAEDSSKLVACLHSRTDNEYRLLDIKPYTGWLPWGPVIDIFSKVRSSGFLPKSPEEMFRGGIDFSPDFAVLTGTSRDEGLTVISTDQSVSGLNYRFSADDFNHKIKDLQRMYNYSINAQSVFDAIEFMYRPSSDVSNETVIRQAYVNLLTDRYYKAPLYKYAKHLVQNGVRTYIYVFNYTLQGYHHHPHSWQGITSAAEYLLITGAPFMDPKYYPPYLNLKAAEWTVADRKMSSFYLQSWTDFAKYGNPTKNSFLNAILWQPATKENLLFLNLNGTNETAEMMRDYRKQECEFWNCYVPLLVKREFSTVAPTLEPGVEELRIVTGALYGSVAAGTLLLLITIVCSVLYCRIRKYDSY